MTGRQSDDSYGSGASTRSGMVLKTTVVRRFISSLAVGAVWSSGILASCGLPTIPFLAPPQNADLSDDSPNEVNPILTFEHNPENAVDDFRGYDLYYKLYLLSQEDEIANDSEIIDSEPAPPGPSRLISRGFVRPVAVSERDASGTETNEILTDDGVPHLPTTPSESPIDFRIDLRTGGDIGADPDADVIVAWDDRGGKARGFRRRSSNNFGADPQNDLDSFWERAGYGLENDEVVDYDLPEMGFTPELLATPPDRLIIIWYALAVADTVEGGIYWSEPLRLPRAEIFLRP